MTYEQIAKMIPVAYRKEILEANIIGSAIASADNKSMQYLGAIWKTYIDSNEKLDCGLCLERLLKNYRELQPVFIKMEKQRKLLESV